MSQFRAKWVPLLLRYRAIDWLFVGMLIILNAIIYVTQPHHRYVSNGDFTLSYPLEDETVPAWALAMMAVVLPLFVFSIFYGFKRHHSHAAAEFQSLFLAFALDLLMTIFATDCIKKMAGRPRPNFFALTQWTNGAPGPNAKASDVRQAYQSFVSGHTSLAFAGLMFLAQFLFQHLSSLSPLHIATSLAVHKQPIHQLAKTNNFFSLFIPFLPIALATYIGLTRIVDYWHFCEDVVGGALVGAFFATTCFNYCYLERKWTWLHLHPMPEAAEYTNLNQSINQSINDGYVNRVVDEEKMEMIKSMGGTSSAPHSRESSAINI